MIKRVRNASVALAVIASILLAGCGIGSSNAAAVVGSLGDAAFQVINLVQDYNDGNVFKVAPDSILLAKDAIKLVTTLNADESPPQNTAKGHIIVSILYDKRGVSSQDVYDINSGKASLGILFQGGTTFETFSGNTVDIDASQTNKITIVPLQNATNKVTVNANGGWQNTGIFLERGKQFSIKYATGLWTISKSVGTSDAAGQPANPPPNLICRCGEPLEGYSTQALIGRIGSGVGYTPLEVGDSFTFISYSNDFLYLRMNVPDQLLQAANGSVTLEVSTNNNA